MSNYNVGIFTHHNFPCDQEIRIHKIISTLQSNKVNSYVFCPGEVGEKQYIHHNNTIIEKILPLKASILNKIKFSRIPINLYWSFRALKKIRKHKIDLVIVRDLRLFIPVLISAKILKRKIILDIGEHYPGMMEILGKDNIFHYITRNKFLITILEILSVYFADYVWVVVEENKKRLLKYNSNIEVISNFPIDDDSWKSLPPKEIISTEEKKYSILSFGLIDNIRGLDLAIDVMKIFRKEGRNIILDIVGDGVYKKHLQRRVCEENLDEIVNFLGWIKSDDRYKVMTNYDLGIIFHDVCDLTNNTIPNKLFDYMAVGLPIVSTKLKPIINVLEDEGCGIYVDNNPESASSKIKSLLDNVSKRKRMSKNARSAMFSRYSWHKEEEKIINRLNYFGRKI